MVGVGEGRWTGGAEGNQLGSGEAWKVVDNSSCCLDPIQYPPTPPIVKIKTAMRINVNTLNFPGWAGVFSSKCISF